MKKLLSLKEKRELLQRMAKAVRRGVALDAFCEKENIERGVLFEHLVEMRAIGTKEINPFLPDVELKKLTWAEKFQAVEKISEYAAKKGITKALVCQLAGIHRSLFMSWQKALQIHEIKAKGKYPPRIDSRKLTARQKRRIFAAVYKIHQKEKRRLANKVITNVNCGISLKQAIKKAGIGISTYYNWKKKFAALTLTRMPRITPDEARRRTLLVDAVTAEINSGKTSKQATREAGMSLIRYNNWKKRFSTLKLLPLGKRLPPIPAEKARYRTRLVDSICNDVNNGMTLKDAIKKAGIYPSIFQLWRKKHGTVKRNVINDEDRRRVVDTINEAVNRGTLLKDAVKKAGIGETSFYSWEKKFGTVKRLIALNDEDRRRVVDTIGEAVNAGKTVRESCRNAGIFPKTFRDWEKRFGTVKRVTVNKDDYRRHVANAIVTDINRGMRVKQAAKMRGISPQVFWLWEKSHATVKRDKSRFNPKSPEDVQEKTRLVDSITKAINRGVPAEQARKEAGVARTNYRNWLKYGTIKLLPRWKRPPAPDKIRRKKRIVNAILNDVKHGMKVRDAAKKAGITNGYFYELKKSLETNHVAKKTVDLNPNKRS